MLYDCAIIGGGLGGLALAILLARKHKKVILFEKETYPFHKVCGEYISMESWDFIGSLGVELGEMSLPMINKLQISACNGNSITQNLDLGGFGISRYTLDNELVKIAKKLGVTVLDNTKVDSINFENEIFTITANHTEYIAKIACGAYGKRSNIDVKLKRKFVVNVPPASQNFVGVKYHVVADLPKNVIELHNFKDGYCGISKVDNLSQNDNKDEINKQNKERYCLCYLTTAKNLQENNNKIADMEKNVLMKNPYLQRYFSEFERLYDKPLVISQINFQAKKIVENHILMLGDAAGLITPLCGNGMSMALHAAKLLSELLNNFLEQNQENSPINSQNRKQLEQEYEKIWHQNFSQRVIAGRVIQKLFGNPTLTNTAISLLKPFPYVINKLVGLTHGKPF
jgi:flavin-dependent dehydrogenase